MTGSSFSYDTGGNGSADFDVAIEGASEYTGPIFDYSPSSSDAGFASTLQTAPGVQFYLNDNSGSTTFNSADAVTPSQLKALLDGFQTSNGWNPGSGSLLVGMYIPISNSDAGLGTDTDGDRMFNLDDDIGAEAEDVNPAPEPASAGLIATASFALLRRRGRHVDQVS